MRLTVAMPRDPKQQKALIIMRAIYNAEPGNEKRAVKKALKKFKKARKAA